MPNLTEMFSVYSYFRSGSEISIKNDTNRFNNHLQPFFENLLISDITTLNVYEFRKYLESKKLSCQTVHHCLALLRAIINKSILLGYNPNGILPYFDMPNFNNSRVGYLSQAEAEKILNLLKTKSELWYEISYFALLTGLRAREIFNLKKENFDQENMFINVFDAKTIHSRHIPVNKECNKILNNRMKKIKSGEYIYSYNPNKKTNCVSKTYFSCIKKLGLNNNVNDRREKVCFHTLRHTFASWLVQSGTPLMVVSSLLGHTTTKMTMRYAHLADKQFKEAINSLPTLVRKQLCPAFAGLWSRL